MAQIYRLFGVEFTPTRLETKHPDFDRTGFEIGNKIGFDRVGRAVHEHTIFAEMGINPDSFGAMEFEDEVKYGNSVTNDFVRDIIAGYEHSNAHMKMAQEACQKLAYCMYYLGRKRVDSVFTFDPVTLEEYKKYEFQLKTKLVDNEPGEPILASQVFGYASNIKGGHLYVGKDQVEFGIHHDMAYTQETCRAIHNYVGSIVDGLYDVIEKIMFQEQRDAVAANIRQVVEQEVQMNPLGGPYPDWELPNFYLPPKVVNTNPR